VVIDGPKRRNEELVGGSACGPDTACRRTSFSRCKFSETKSAHAGKEIVASPDENLRLEVNGTAERREGRGRVIKGCVALPREEKRLPEAHEPRRGIGEGKERIDAG